MSRQPRDRDAEQTTIRAAIDRLLAGTPLRSSTGKLTGTELIAESGLRRDVVYGDHRDLVEEFQARVKTQHAVPAAVEKVAEQNRALKEENATLKADLATEREKTKALARIAVELSLELEQAREELASAPTVTRIRNR
ncbi:hypothetical protein [Streptomyces celluloflavus]|uniref:Uncharacterized protein n=1 Tax=Streptomyces celluloflavus TaxID=58344 RepID=A0ABW7R5D3_9ACTN|nr:hypothetical protein OG717_26705 [Streptomyces celluloflavus]